MEMAYVIGDTPSETSEATSAMDSWDRHSEGSSNPADLTEGDRTSLAGTNPSLSARLQTCYDRHRRRMRGVGSKGSILVLVWSFVVYGSSVSALESFAVRLSKYLTDIDLIWTYLLPQLIIYSSWMFLFPLCGWIADVYFGRYRVLNFGLHILWLGTALFAVGLVLESYYSGTKYYVLLSAIILVAFGRSAFLVNSVLFGSDQIFRMSAEEFSSYIIWYFFAWLSSRWLYNLITTAILYCGSVGEDKGFVIQTMISLALLSLVLCSNYLLRNSWLLLSTEPLSDNPWKLVWRVVKFSATHTRPAPRSTLTIESVRRIDLGKMHYGGPFTVEQVDDVKTLFRVSLIVIGFCGLGMFIGGLSMVPELLFLNHLDRHLKGCDVLCQQMYSYPFLVTVGVPIYELLLYPLIKRWLPSMLKRVGIAAVLAVLLHLCLLSVSVIGNEQSEICFLTNFTMVDMDINSLSVELPFNFIHALVIVIALTAALEFVYAQTPYCMQGLAVGMFFGLTGTSAVFGLTLIIIWHFLWDKPLSKPNCGVWFFLFTTVLAILVVLAYCLLAKWYKLRERQDCPSGQRYRFPHHTKYGSANTANSSLM